MVQKLKFYSYFPKEVGKARSSDKSEKRVRGELIAREKPVAAITQQHSEV